MKILKCGCCGERAPGKQHWNRDKGIGLCPRCVLTILDNPYAGPNELKSYGTPGIHFAIPLSLAGREIQKETLIAWRKFNNDGEFNGWHIGVFKEWDNGTAIANENGKEVAI